MHLVVDIDKCNICTKADPIWGQQRGTLHVNLVRSFCEVRSLFTSINLLPQNSCDG